MALIGHTTCTDPECGAPDIPVYRTTGGKIYAACHRCEMTQQPKMGSAAHRRLLKRMQPCEADEPPAPVPAPEPKPAPAKASKAASKPAGFQLGAL